ncbi:MAG: hypothetical protein QF632_01530 [Candidatus Woesearchaeota archaeon]|nr:hypothetical protein [Candidatus Woesearchaeota archaeon]
MRKFTLLMILFIGSLLLLSSCNQEGGSGGCGASEDKGKCDCNQGKCKWVKDKSGTQDGSCQGCQNQEGCNCGQTSEKDRKKEEECEDRTPGNNNQGSGNTGGSTNGGTGGSGSGSSGDG